MLIETRLLATMQQKKQFSLEKIQHIKAITSFIVFNFVLRSQSDFNWNENWIERASNALWTLI